MGQQPGSSAMARALILLAVLSFMRESYGAFDSPLGTLPHVEKYERVTPRRLSTVPWKRDLSAQVGTYPDQVHFSIRTEGRDYILHLQKNTGLIGDHYMETYDLENGTEVTEKPGAQDHCFYHGHIEGHSNSAASIRTCEGLRGFFQTSQRVYFIDPLEGTEAGEHALYKPYHLRRRRGTCGDPNVTLEYDHKPKVAAAMKPHDWKSTSFQQGTRYIELFVVVDNAEYKTYNDMQKLRNRVKEIVNHVDKLYQSLNFRVALMGLEVWNYKDRITVSSNPDTTLDNFLHWCKTELLKKNKRDNVQLITMMFPKRFSSCSADDLQKFLSDATTSCLLNVPKVDELYGGPVCGNQFVEQGEQCDCGTLEECRDPCCNATTCRLLDGSECAQGGCCHHCKVRPAGVLCRPSKNNCDLPEHCTGHAAECPEDVFRENGYSCQGGDGYCYNGVCPTHLEHCHLLWGAAAQVAPDICFEYNGHPMKYLHCMTESGRKPCNPKDIKCGTLHCLSGNASPITGGVYSLTIGRVTCKAAITDVGESDMVSNLVLVPTGTKCGEEMVCYAGRCQDLQVYGAKNCSAKCNNHGVCTHKRKCHCDPGWAAPYCEQKLSEIMSGGSNVTLAVVLTVVVLLALACLGVFVFIKGNGKRYLQERKISAHSRAGRANPVFQGDSNKGAVRNQQQHHDISHPSPIPPASELQSTQPMAPSLPPPKVKPSPPPKPLLELHCKQGTGLKVALTPPAQWR
uniref:ADAM metallopeptidase domain 8 n=1 Tax=Sphenodon punctatus TaxID=8508 RepID=A0A8D0G790_SPHPU